jgi:hypothetical protein
MNGNKIAVGLSLTWVRYTGEFVARAKDAIHQFGAS